MYGNRPPLGVLAVLVLTSLLASASFALDGKGDHHHDAVHHPVTTSSDAAQRLFDEGLGQAYGFNHEAAAESFRRATKADSECAMCWWGLALSLGPNINFPMDPANHPEARAALDRALALAPAVTDQERAYITALSERYAEEWVEDRAHLDQAYAKAMRRVARRFPDDLDAQVLFAEALMDTTPWDYWLDDGSPKQVTEEFLGVLESVLQRDPTHPGGAHFLIHAVEKARPELGVPAADALASTPQATGHLRHMASHIYIRVGRYHDAVRVNQEAIEHDRQMMAGDHQPGIYTTFLAPHNVHMLWANATLEGNVDVALEAARDLHEGIDTELMRQPDMETLQHFWLSPLYSQVRFGHWDEILAEPKPDADLLYPTAVWHYARTMALVRKGRLDEAAKEHAALERFAADPRLDELTVFGVNTMRSLVQIGAGIAGGELAAAQGNVDLAVERLEQAVAREDALAYDEPPPWNLPARQVLGQVLLEAGRAGEAERVYRADLEVFPHNGWSLWGLEQSLRAQGKDAEAEVVEARLETAWQHADFELSASRL